MRISKTAGRLAGQPMFKLLAQIKEKEALGENFVHFEIGDPDFESPKCVIDSCVDILKSGGGTHYTPSQGLLELRQEIADYHSKLNNLKKPLKPSNIVIAPGCNPLIYCIFKCLVNDGDRVDFPFFAFPTYLSMHTHMNLKRCPMPKKGKPFDYAKVNSKLRVLISPSNPVGQIIPDEYLQSSVEEVRNANGFTLSDEIYQLMTYTGKPATSILKYDPELKNSVIISGYSKAFSMTGWRIGYMIGNEKLCEKITTMLQMIVSCTNTFVQKSCLGLLANHPPELASNLAELKTRRDILVEGLNGLPGVKCGIPDGAIYAFPNISGTGMTSDDFVKLMFKNKVALLSGNDFTHIKDMGDKYVRLAYCTSQDNIREGLKRMKEALS